MEISRGAPALIAIALLPFAASAQTTAQTQAQQELDQRLRVLERKLEIDAEAAQAKAKEATTPAASDKGFGLKSADGNFELKIRTLVQADLRTFLDDRDDRRAVDANSNNAALTARNGSSDGFLFRRVRPTFEGTFGKLVGFRITPEFAGAGDAETASLVDAYVDLKFSPAATVRAGKVKGPVSLERLQSGGAITFIERGFPSELAPNRDLGAQLQGDLLGSKLNYVVGLYNGTPDGRNANLNADNRFEVGARLFAEPFRDSANALSGLGFGVAATSGSKFQVVTADAGASVRSQGRADHINNYAAQANPLLPRYRTPGQNQLFSYRGAEGSTATATVTRTGVYAAGDHLRVSPQAYYYLNSFGLLGEYITSEQEVGLNGVSQEFEHKAWQVTASYVLTGENASYRAVQKVENPYTPGGDGWGALELAARYGVLDIDDDVFAPVAASGTFTATTFADPGASASEATSWTVGANWYLTNAAKLSLNYTNTGFDGGAQAATGTTTADNARDRIDEKAVFVRVQLQF